MYDFDYYCEDTTTVTEYPVGDRVPVPVENVTAVATKRWDQGETVYFYEIDVSWTAASGSWPVSHYEVFHKLDSSNAGWFEPTVSTGTTATIIAHLRSQTSVTYKIVVIPVSHYGRRHHIDDATEVSVTTPT